MTQGADGVAAKCVVLGSLKSLIRILDGYQSFIVTTSSAAMRH